LHSNCTKDLAVMTDSTLYFHYHLNSVYTHALRVLGFVYYITHNFSSLDSLVGLYNALTRSKLSASFICNNFTFKLITTK
jgi:ABC-type arginine transport system permease subunit